MTSAANDRPARRHRILVVDDNPAIHEDFRKILCTEQDPEVDELRAMEERLTFAVPQPMDVPEFELDSALQGRDALRRVLAALAEQRPYQIAFVDHRMPPGWDGIETIEHLWDAAPDLQVVVCTAYSDCTWEEMIARLGRNDQLLILKKPFDSIEVLQMATCLSAKWELNEERQARLANLGILVEQRTADLAAANAGLRGEIDRHRRARAELQQVSQRLQLILDSAGEGVCGVDRSGSITFANQAAAVMIGRTVAEMVGTRLVELVQPGADEIRGIEVACGEGVGSRCDDATFTRGDGSAFPVSSISTPIREQGAIVGAVLVFRDVTEGRRIEEEMRRARRTAEQATIAKSEFLANMSHETRTPLNVIMGMAEILADAHLADDHQRCVDSILANARNLLHLVDEVLDLSRVEAGRIELVTDELDVGALLDDVLQAFAGTAAAKRIGLRRAGDDRFPRLLGDPQRLRQVLTNLVANAVKFTSRGEVVLTAELVGQVGADATLELSVRDTGIGIAPERHRAIFERFTQAERTTGERFGGTGLGLTICAQLVGMMGGTIRLASTPGSGSCFTVLLKLGTAPVEQRAGATAVLAS